MERIGKLSCPLPNDTDDSGPERFSVFDEACVRVACSIAWTCF